MAPASLRSAFSPALLVLRNRTILLLALTSLVYGGVQITLVAYLVTFCRIRSRSRWCSPAW
jgi:hypothetical protein